MSGNWDLLIAGGGPAGSALACLAARQGLRVALLERARFPRDKVCGEFVSAEGCGVLRRLSALATLEQAGGRWMNSLRLTDVSGREVVAPLPELPGTGRDALGISRARLDHVLLELARAAGAVALEQQEVIAPLIEAGQLTGVRARRDGSRDVFQAIRATVVVGADGRRSALARSLAPQLGDPTRTTPRSWFGLKAHLAVDPSRLGGRVELHLFQGGYAGLAAVEGQVVNLCLLVTVRALQECGGSPARVLAERVLANPAVRAIVGDGKAAGAWKSLGPLRFGVRRPAAGGALFVGDAAGTIDPFCGEGISNALRGAELALPVIEQAAGRGGVTPDMQQAYHRAWMREFAPVTRRVRRLGRVLERPRLAGALLSLLGGAARGLVPRVVAATRTAS